MFGFQNGLWNPYGQNFQNPWQQNAFGGFNPFQSGFQTGNPFQGVNLDSLFGGTDFGDLLGMRSAPVATPPDLNPANRVAAPPKPRLTRQEKINKRLTDPQAVIQGKAGPYSWGAR